ncbi:hypothetical protein B0J14DRAFT_637882 [Halenospora varia]|nr:hypothetical protein B0J14DRAFT_637882 [Halenospora varia]
MGLLLSMIPVLIPSEYCFMETQPGSLNARGVDIHPTSSFFGHRLGLLIFMRVEHKVCKDVLVASNELWMVEGRACGGGGGGGDSYMYVLSSKHCDALLVKVGLERSAALPNRDNRRRSGNQWGGRARICCSRGSTPKCDAVLHQQPAAQLGVVEGLDAPDAQAQRAQEGGRGKEGSRANTRRRPHSVCSAACSFCAAWTSQQRQPSERQQRVSAVKP